MLAIRLSLFTTPGDQLSMYMYVVAPMFDAFLQSALSCICLELEIHIQMLANNIGVTVTFQIAAFLL